MVIYEFRDAAYDTAFELLEEAKRNAKVNKLTLCKLEDAMYDCYEASKDEHESYDPEDTEVEFRGRRGYRDYETDDMREDDDTMHNMRRSSRMRSMRMRRNRMGQFS